MLIEMSLLQTLSGLYHRYVCSSYIPCGISGVSYSIKLLSHEWLITIADFIEYIHSLWL